MPQPPQVYRRRFWMWHYMARTCKPTLVWSTSSQVKSFWRGKLCRAEVQAEKARRNPGNKAPPTRSYKDDQQRARFQGTKTLKETGSATQSLLNQTTWSFCIAELPVCLYSCCHRSQDVHETVWSESCSYGSADGGR